MNNYEFSVLDKVSLHRYIEKVWFISFFIFLFMLLFLFLPWQQTVKGKGIISAYDPTQRPYSISATIDGFIDEFHVEENQFVKKGELLFTMVDLDKKYSTKLKKIEEKTKEQLTNINKQIIISQERKDNLREYLNVGLNVYVQKISQMEDKIKSLELKEVSLEKNHEIEKSNFQRIKSLYEDGIESKRKYDMMENIYIRAKAELEKIAIDIVVERKSIEIIKKEK